MTSYKADANYMKVVPLVLNSEGGYVNHPKDPGGPTNHGIAWNYNAGWIKANTSVQSAAAMRSLTKDDALQCYFERYWLACDAHKITDVDLAYIHFDCAVNCGVGTARRMISKLSVSPFAYDFAGGKNKTLAVKLFHEYRAAREHYYRNCRNRETFLKGWLNRLAAVVRNAAKLD